MKNIRIVRPAHRCQTPVEALQLAEDLERINFAIVVIGRISDASIHESRSEANKEMIAVHSALRRWHLTARSKLKAFLRIDLSHFNEVRRPTNHYEFER
jgi:hypothetical protein